MNYYEIKKAITNYELYLLTLGGFRGEDATITPFSTANFENIVCDYLEALKELKRVRNLNKRACLYYNAIGYNTYQIADKLNITHQAVSANLWWLKNFFGKEVAKQVV